MVGASGSASGYGAGTDGDAGVADAKASLAEAEAGTTKPTQCTPSGIQIAVSALPQWPMPNSSLDVANGAPNPQSYTDNGDGTVTDKVTGLMWQQTAPPGLYTPANAELYCKLLTTGNHCDWRAPEFIELYSIVDYSQRNPAIDPTFFLGTLIDAVYWSATPDKFGSYFAVFFYDGSASGGPSTGTNLAHVRCVRFTVPYTVPVGVHPPRYTTSKDDAGTGTVYDPVTKLTWQQTPTTMLFNLANAKTYCPGLAGGWRFPTAKELMTLNPIDPTVFPYFANVSYWWSSTALVAAPNVVYMPFNSWYVNLYSSQVEYGLALSSAGGSMDRLMCVR